MNAMNPQRQTATQTRIEQLRANQPRTAGETIHAQRAASGNYDRLPGGATECKPTLPPSSPVTQPGTPCNQQRAWGIPPAPANVADAAPGPAIRSKGGK